MVAGIRTIKSYGWEHHYSAKITEARDKQAKFVWYVNVLSSMGQTIFNNFGFYAFLTIILVTYWRGEQIETGKSMAMLSILFFLFMSVNGLTAYATNTLFQFFAIMNRVGDVFKLGEFHSTRQKADTLTEVTIKIEQGSYSWGFKVKKDDNNTALKDRLELEEDVGAVLSEVNLDLKYNDTLVVVGKIGTGKTTLLNSIMDETVKLSGTQKVKGTIAYVE